MSAWTTTKSKIQQRIETLVKRIAGQETLTYSEKAVISDAINMTIIDLSTERSIGLLHCIIEDTDEDTTASQNYIDLDTDVLQIVDGTVRIESENQILNRMNLKSFYAMDVGEDITGMPSRYAIGANAGVMRMYLRNTPNAVYTISFQAKKILDEDSTSTFPAWFHPLLFSGSAAQSLENLGLDGSLHRARYNDRLLNINSLQKGHTGPIHLKIRTEPNVYRAPELRNS